MTGTLMLFLRRSTVDTHESQPYPRLLIMTQGAYLPSPTPSFLLGGFIPSQSFTRSTKYPRAVGSEGFKGQAAVCDLPFSRATHRETKRAPGTASGIIGLLTAEAEFSNPLGQICSQSPGTAPSRVTSGAGGRSDGHHKGDAPCRQDLGCLAGSIHMRWRPGSTGLFSLFEM